MSNYNLKQEIKKLGMTQKSFAEDIGVGENTVGNWVRGVIETPPWAKRLVELLRIEKDFNNAKKIFCNK
jgi:transcriptional regulator with XRE-family HTH domain